MNDIIKRDGDRPAAICHELESAKRRAKEAEAQVAAMREEVERLRARKAERCSRRILWDDGCCPKWCAECGGSGAVIVEAEK